MIKKIEKSSQSYKCPFIFGNVEGIPVSILVDTGSQITCISEKLFRRLESQGKFDILPVSNILVLPAIGKKATPVKKQILIEVKIGDIVSRCALLVLPGLTNEMIFGNDWLSINRAVLDYNKKNNSD